MKDKGIEYEVEKWREKGSPHKCIIQDGDMKIIGFINDETKAIIEDQIKAYDLWSEKLHKDK